MTVLLSLQGICKAYRRGDARLHVLRGVSLHVARGEVVSIIATRAQGTSTLLRLATGLERPDEGRVLFDGNDLATLDDHELSRLLREDIGLAGRSGPGMRLKMSEYVETALLLGVGRSARRERRARALWALERVGIPNRAGERWEALSNWERALAELAQAIVAKPRLLVIDDVADGLSMRETERIAELLRSIADESGAGVLMGVSSAEAALGSDRIHTLFRGELETLADLTGSASNVIHPPGERWSRRAGRAVPNA